jgi:hypothetical protein
MPRFNQFIYNTANYGFKALLELSAEPLAAEAIRYDAVKVSYSVPSAAAGESYVGFRIIRNQEGIPLSQEDGYAIIDVAGPPNGGDIFDASNAVAPLVDGKFVYYRAWIRKSAASDWVPAGFAYTLVPKKNTLSLPSDTKYSVRETPTADGYVKELDSLNLGISSTHERFMGLLPSVLTSTTNSALDAIEDNYVYSGPNAEVTGVKENSLLSTFLSGFSFTVDEFLTFAKLIQPDNPGHGASPTTVLLKSHELGLTDDFEVVTVSQKKLMRNAVDIYKEKGTASGLELYAKSITDYEATVAETANLLLSHEDATFDIAGWNTGDAVGRWAALSGSPVISVVTGLDAPLLAGSLDKQGSYGTFSASVDTNAAGTAIALGVFAPVTDGIPVTAGSYSLSFYAKKADSSGNATPEIRWFDRNGVYLSSSTSAAKSITTSWARHEYLNVAAPTGACYAVLVLTFAADSIYYLDSIQFEKAATASAYVEPRGAVITLSPTKTNEIINPSFESGVSGWTTTNCTITNLNTQVFSGDVSARTTASSTGVVAITTTAYMTVTPSTTYTASAYFYKGNFDSDAKVQILFYSSSNTLLSTINGTTVGAATSWRRTIATGTSGATAVKAKVVITTTGSVTSGRIGYIDAVQLEKSSAASDYFDGASAVFNDTYWEGTAGASRSFYYLAGSNKINRLAKEVKDYVPFDTPYYITFPGSSSFTGSLSGIG